MKNKVECSVHCHATEFDCHNLSELAIRTEMALVDRGMEEDEQFPEEEQLQEEKQPQEEGPREDGPQEEQSQEEEELREEEQPQEQDYGLSGIQDSNDLPPPSRKRTRQATQPQHRNVRREGEFRERRRGCSSCSPEIDPWVVSRIQMIVGDSEGVG